MRLVGSYSTKMSSSFFSANLASEESTATLHVQFHQFLLYISVNYVCNLLLHSTAVCRLSWHRPFRHSGCSEVL